MRVLFVDDEQRVLNGIENALLFSDYEWDTVFANSGDQAVASMSEQSFDVLVTDMKMPGMTGADILSHARDHYPGTVRIVLSGEFDESLARTAMPLTHEFVSKPCDPDDLFGIIAKVHANARSLDNSRITTLVSGLDTLPTQPRVFSEIQACIANDGGIAEVAAIAESDVAVATSVIRTANSAFYGFGKQVTTVRDAASRLGTDAVSGIALSAELAANAAPDIVRDLEILNELSANVGRVVQRLIGSEIPQAGLAGLMRSLGVIVFITCVGDDYRPVQEQFRLTGLPDDDIELRLFGATHAELGAYVMRMWKMDDLVVESVQHHRNPGFASPEAQRVIHAMAAADAALCPDRPRPDWIDDELVAAACAIVEGAGR